MTTLTHIAVGAVLAKAALTGAHVQADPAAVYAVAILFSNLPDIDIPLFGLKRTVATNWNHRIHSFLHFPLFWGFLLILYLVLAPQPMRQSIEPYETVALIALGLHFLMDTVGVDRGICWLGPFMKKEMSFTRLVAKPDRFGVYLLTYCRSAVFKTELIIWLGSILYLLIKKPV